MRHSYGPAPSPKCLDPPPGRPRWAGPGRSTATAATDKKGGPGGEKRCDICGTTFTGTIANLATGTYNAFARMIFQDNAMKTRYWDSPQVSLTVK